MSTPETPKQGSSGSTLIKDSPVTLPTKLSSNQLTEGLLMSTGFDANKILYLFKQGMTSPARIVHFYTSGMLQSYKDTDKFSKGAVATLLMFAQYLLWYKTAHNRYADIGTNFMSETFE